MMVSSWLIVMAMTKLWCEPVDALSVSPWNAGWTSVRTPVVNNIGSRSRRSMSWKRRMTEPSIVEMAEDDGYEEEEDMWKEGRMSRRRAIMKSCSATARAMAAMTYAPSIMSPPPAAAAATTTSADHLSAAWKASDGLNTNADNQSSPKFISFDPSAYKAMKDDQTRTPIFEKAIAQRLRNSPDGTPPSSQTVLDLGTGPFALFAIAAAQAGAGTVYAIEVDRRAAQSARKTIQELGFEDVVTVFEGFSTDVTLPGKADFAIAEIVGSVASEEGVCATIRDAHRRHLKRPERASSWIPSRVQTYAAPAAYTLHNLFRPPAFEWGKLEGEPVRFNCRDQGLQLVSGPLLIEDVRFNELDANNTVVPNDKLTWTVDEDRLLENTSRFRDELRKGGLKKDELETMAFNAGRSVSGIALWPRLILDADEKIQINTRSYPDGDHQRSHWQTVLPIMSDVPIKVKGGDEISINVDFRVPDSVLKSPTYNMEGDVIRKS